MAQNYECVLLMDPELSDEKVQEYIDQISKIITDHSGEVVHMQKWGRRKLEYPIAARAEAIYVILHFHSDIPAGDVIIEIERCVRINEDLLREMTVKVPELRVMDAPTLGPRATGINPSPHRGTPPRQGGGPPSRGGGGGGGGGRRPDRGGSRDYAGASDAQTESPKADSEEAQTSES